jgi:hypothetical protein
MSEVVGTPLANLLQEIRGIDNLRGTNVDTFQHADKACTLRPNAGIITLTGPLPLNINYSRLTLFMETFNI